MKKSRRVLLLIFAALGPLMLGNAMALRQAPPKRNPFPSPPASAETQNPAESQSPKQDAERAKRAALAQNEREFRAGVARLNQMTAELKQQIDQTPTTEVFSVQMYKRMEEIAKLAKQLQAKAKG